MATAHLRSSINADLTISLWIEITGKKPSISEKMNWGPFATIWLAEMALKTKVDEFKLELKSERPELPLVDLFDL